MRKIIESTLVPLDGVIEDPQLRASDYFDHHAREGRWRRDYGC
jgi:hypothetical protein